MSAGTAADLLADLLNPPAPLATVATLATNEHWRGSPADFRIGDTWRHVATAAAVSPRVASRRQPTNRPESKHWRGLSPMSPMSPRVPRDNESAAEPGARPRTCADCAHRLRPGTCATPIAAGLIAPGAGFGWPPAGHAGKCPASARRKEGRSG
ncbi:MAG TPA: hypothetical protein P5163_00030 [Rubrivivax sp.]|nr:hypothetical protein [Rubrivivax sp.]